MKLPKDKIIIASDISDRDGIGIEVYRNDKLIIEILHDTNFYLPLKYS